MAERVAPNLVPLVQRVHSRLRPGFMLDPAPHIAFYPYANGTSTVRERHGRLHFRFSHHVEGAPDDVLEGLASVLLSKIHRVPLSRADAHAVRAYRDYLNRERVGAAPTSRGRKHIDPVGAHRSLLESFLRVTLDMGLALPRVPTLSWSKTVARHRFGHWDSDHNAVVISQVLDDPKVPEFVLDYVLYHELLHILHPARMGSGTKRIVHSALFRRDERKFPRWREGEEWIAKLARRRA